MVIYTPEPLEVLTNTVLTGLWTIFERNGSFVCKTKKVLDLWIQLMKDGSKNQSVAFLFLFSVCSLMSGIHQNSVAFYALIFSK